jgi:dTDP-4-amino-4,6-dideoxygalactose transaminase
MRRQKRPVPTGSVVRSPAKVTLSSFAVARDAAASDSATSAIPVLRPRLPQARDLLPYLERIDESRTYSNWGPLVRELSERLAVKLSAPHGGVVCANSGMSALVGAILATAGRATRQRPLAIVPDYTFTASALAAQMCGYELVLASCGENNWTFIPDDLNAQQSKLDQVGLVMPVAPFGRLVAQDPWLRFQQRTGIPVVIDGAGCFDVLLTEGQSGLGLLPVVLSFHATKCFGTGEGGCVVTSDAELGENVLRCLNFGFLESRNTAMPGTNGKMSEYAAAVGLAELDGWDRKHEEFLKVFLTYRQCIRAAGVPNRLWGPPDVSCAYVILECANVRQAADVVAALSADRIDTRLWYGTGLHAHDAFRNQQRLNLHGLRGLDPHLLVGLPTAVDLTRHDIERVCVAIARAVC